MSLHTFATSPALPVNAVVCLSGYLACREKIGSIVNPAIPVFMGHGTSDPVVPFKWGKESVDVLKSKGASSVAFQAYQGMLHSCCQQELDDVVRFLKSIVK